MWGNENGLFDRLPGGRDPPKMCPTPLWGVGICHSPRRVGRAARRWSHGAAGSSPASSHLSKPASGAAGSSPTSSHLCPWGPPDRRSGDATRTANSRRLAASPTRLYYTKTSVIFFLIFCWLPPAGDPVNPSGPTSRGRPFGTAPRGGRPVITRLGLVGISKAKL